MNDDLFRGAAEYYAAYRRPYPPEVVTYLVDTLGLDGRGRLLDGGCGTGQAFSVLAEYFDEVFAFDRDPTMAELARKTAADAHLSNVVVAQMKAEELRSDHGTFRLAIFAASFHWMDRPRVAELVYELLEPGGHIAVLAPSPLHTGNGPLEVAIRDTVAEWLGSERRAGGGMYLPSERHAEALAKTRFGPPTTADIYVEERWDIEQITGWLFSTSFANQALLGANTSAFEASLRERLLKLAPDGRFLRTVEHTVIWAEKGGYGGSVS